MDFGSIFGGVSNSASSANVVANIIPNFLPEEIHRESNEATRRKLIDLLWPHCEGMTNFLTMADNLVSEGHEAVFTDEYDRSKYLSLLLQRALTSIEEAEDKKTHCDTLWCGKLHTSMMDELGDNPSFPDIFSSFGDMIKNQGASDSTISFFDKLKDITLELPQLSQTGNSIDLDEELNSL